VGADRKGEYFRKALTVGNGSGAVYQDVGVVGTLAGYSNESLSGKVFVAQTPENYQHDWDGNLTQDGRWNYTWDGENRLVKMESLAGAPLESRRRLEFQYDWRGRRIMRKITNLHTSAVTETRYVYDDWNLIAELNTSLSVVRSYVWGLDLSGSLRGAGGVGGLVLVTPAGQNAQFPAYDGNGNVVGLVDGVGGTVTARYEYGLFGEVIRTSGTMAPSNPFRFSTKYTDTESGMLYYGYRYYNPSTGRWLSRDPLEEEGGANLYVFVRNDGIGQVDVLGELSLDDVISGNIGYDKSWGLLGPFGVPVGPSGVRFQITAYISGNFLVCCDKGKKQRYASGILGLEAYVLWGKSYQRTPPVKGRDRNKPHPGGGKQKDHADKEIPPDSGFRSSDWHVDLTAPAVQCPPPGLQIDGSGYIFLRGSGGAYYGFQFNIEKTIKKGVDFTEGWSLSASGARNVYGLTIEGGGGGRFNFTYGPLY
jgi:RHS repeat-associated protein